MGRRVAEGVGREAEDRTSRRSVLLDAQIWSAKQRFERIGELAVQIETVGTRAKAEEIRTELLNLLQETRDEADDLEDTVERTHGQSAHDRAWVLRARETVSGLRRDYTEIGVVISQLKSAIAGRGLHPPRGAVPDERRTFEIERLRAMYCIARHVDQDRSNLPEEVLAALKVLDEINPGWTVAAVARNRGQEFSVQTGEIVPAPAEPDSAGERLAEQHPGAPASQS